jgi:hypothetical protein
MPEHPHLGTIRRYYEGCTTASRELMLSTFAPDIVHYFPDSPPIRGAETLANFWLSFFEDGRLAVWSVDHGIVEGDEAVIEWTMLYTRPAKTPPVFIERGAEWYVFRDGLISEIRAYELLAGDHPQELIAYPYAERGYPTAPAGSTGQDPSQVTKP